MLTAELVQAVIVSLGMSRSTIKFLIFLFSSNKYLEEERLAATIIVHKLIAQRGFEFMFALLLQGAHDKGRI